MKNEIVGLITSESDSNLSCGELISDHIKEAKNELLRADIQTAISTYIDKHKRADWKIYHAQDFNLDKGSIFPKWILDSIEVGNRLTTEHSFVLKNTLEILRKQGLDIVIKKPNEKTKPDPNQGKINADE